MFFNLLFSTHKRAFGREDKKKMFANYAINKIKFHQNSIKKSTTFEVKGRGRTKAGISYENEVKWHR